MKLEKGMYVRFKPELKEKICEIKEFKNDGFLVLIDNTEYWFEKKDVLKASYDIIDLIEAGDLIETQFGISNVIVKNDKYLCTYEDSYLTIDEIKRVLTKEEFENMAYEVNH